MLYTAVLLERVYVDHNAKDQAIKDATEPEYMEVLLKHGRVVTRRTEKIMLFIGLFPPI